MSDVESHVNGEAEYKVSDIEIKCFREMVEEFVAFLQNTEIMNEDVEIDENMLDDVCESMTKTCNDEEWEDE